LKEVALYLTGDYSDRIFIKEISKKLNCELVMPEIKGEGLFEENCFRYCTFDERLDKYKLIITEPIKSLRALLKELPLLLYYQGTTILQSFRKVKRQPLGYEYRTLIDEIVNLLAKDNVTIGYFHKKQFKIFDSFFTGLDKVLIPLFKWESIPEVIPYNERKYDVGIVTSDFHIDDSLITMIHLLARKGFKILVKMYTNKQGDVSAFKYIFPSNVIVIDKPLTYNGYLKLLSQCKVFYHSSTEEFLGVRLIEEMAFAPVVSSTNEFWFSSLIYKPILNDALGIIVSLLKDESEWEEFFRKCREESLSFTKTKFDNELKSLVNFLANKYSLEVKEE